MGGGISNDKGKQLWTRVKAVKQVKKKQKVTLTLLFLLQVEALEDELVTLKKNLRAKEECLSSAEERTARLEENNNHLEQKLVELMTKTGDREAQYVARWGRGKGCHDLLYHGIGIKELTRLIISSVFLILKALLVLNWETEP